MPHEFHDLPVHPLVVHAAVVLIPLATLLAILFVIPRTRGWAALPMVLVSVAGLVAVWMARLTGLNLKATLEELGGGDQWAASPIGKAVADHQAKANWLFYFMIVFAIIAVVVYLLWRRPGQFTGVVEYVACGVLLVGAVLVGVQTARTGEAGSKAVWNPDGNADYGSVARVVSPQQLRGY